MEFACLGLALVLALLMVGMRLVNDRRPTYYELAAPVTGPDGQEYNGVYQDRGWPAGLGTVDPNYPGGGYVRGPGWQRTDTEDIPLHHEPPAGWERSVKRAWR